MRRFQSCHAERAGASSKQSNPDSVRSSSEFIGIGNKGKRRAVKFSFRLTLRECVSLQAFRERPAPAHEHTPAGGGVARARSASIDSNRISAEDAVSRFRMRLAFKLAQKSRPLRSAVVVAVLRVANWSSIIATRCAFILSMRSPVPTTAVAAFFDLDARVISKQDSVASIEQKEKRGLNCAMDQFFANFTMPNRCDSFN